MSNTVYKKLLNVAIDEIQKRKDPTKGKKKWAAGTKPNQIGFKSCNNTAHKPGEDRDHMGWECPHKPLKRNQNP